MEPKSLRVRKERLEPINWFLGGIERKFEPSQDRTGPRLVCVQRIPRDQTQDPVVSESRILSVGGRLRMILEISKSTICDVCYFNSFSPETP